MRKQTVDMKKLYLFLILAVGMLAATAQEVIKVNYKGAKPTIDDLAWAYLSSDAGDDGDCIDESLHAAKYAYGQYRKGQPLGDEYRVTVDNKNGYALVEAIDAEEGYTLKVEMCYWNEADGKHKLFACNVAFFKNGVYDPGQFDGLSFMRYNNATRTMSYCDAPGFDARYATDEGHLLSYALPRSGKDIVVTTWHPTGPTMKTLKWDGRRFKY